MEESVILFVLLAAYDVARRVSTQHDMLSRLKGEIASQLELQTVGRSL